MKILNLNEGSFPIKLSFELENHNVPNIGKLTNNLSVEAQILKISKNLYKCDGSIEGNFLDTCHSNLHIFVALLTHYQIFSFFLKGLLLELYLT